VILCRRWYAQLSVHNGVVPCAEIALSEAIIKSQMHIALGQVHKTQILFIAVKMHMQKKPGFIVTYMIREIYPCGLSLVLCPFVIAMTNDKDNLPLSQTNSCRGVLPLVDIIPTVALMMARASFFVKTVGK